MLWFIILGIILFLIIKFSIDKNKDNYDLQYEKFDSKFRIIINSINKYAFNNLGEIVYLDKKKINLYKTGSNNLIQFIYSTGNLIIIWKYKYYKKELIYEKRLDSVRNLSIFEQQIMVDKLISEMETKINNHKNSVLNDLEINTRLNYVENKYFAIIKEGATILTEYKKLSEQGKLEVLIFNTLIVLRVFDKHNHNETSNLQNIILDEILNNASKLNVNKSLADLKKFINDRFIFYSKELALLYGEQGYIPGKLYNVFYLDPLTEEPKMNSNFIEIIPFLQNLTSMINWLSDKTTSSIK